MKFRIFFLLVFFFPLLSIAQWNGNETPTYPRLIQECKALANSHSEIQLFKMGESDYGLPIYLFVVNGGKDSISTFEKARKGTTLLVNNAIHPGEPDGINAMLLWANEWIEKGKPTKDMPVVAFIPAYNIGGMMNRSATSRANQDGPAEYGFRGNAKNLDLNRDCIKMDSKNAFTFAKIFHALDPDVFIDNHVTNGADYQYVLTLISSLKERLAPSMEDATYCKMIPALKKQLVKREIDLIPYIDLVKEIPDSGLVTFDDLPRYAMGYASLFNTFSFTVETHMLKPFPQRVQATKAFLEEMLIYMKENVDLIEKARLEANNFQQNEAYFFHHYELNTEKKDSLLFKGFEAKYKPSEVTGLTRMYYDRKAPFEKMVPYWNAHEATDSVKVPRFYIVGGQEKEVLDRLKANGIKMHRITKDSTVKVVCQKIVDFKTGTNPYEQHYLHSKVKVEYVEMDYHLKPGDYRVPARQEKAFFLQSVLMAQAEDSYFSWNFFDSYMDEKEYFSSYVFEDIAAKLLNDNPDLRAELEAKKASDVEFAKSQWQQLYFVYQRSPYFEPTFRIIPVYLVY
ncbi:MAG: hypothetical protein WC044_14580 [Crocinitomicaceae bacterium]